MLRVPLSPLRHHSRAPARCCCSRPQRAPLPTPTPTLSPSLRAGGPGAMGTGGNLTARRKLADSGATSATASAAVPGPEMAGHAGKLRGSDDDDGGEGGGEGGAKEGAPDGPLEWTSLALLLGLYTLQGVPMGLSSAIPYVLQEHTQDYNKQAVFSMVSWPFALKLLWAPVVDGLWMPSVGRRKTWLIPTQLLIAAVLLWAAGWVDDVLGAPHIDVWLLTYLFLFLYTLCATQDIAVDGWALTILPPNHVDKASICNSIGQTFGYFTSFIGFLILSSEDTCRTYFGADGALVTLGGFMAFYGVVFAVTTLLVAAFKTEGPTLGAEDLTISATYYQLYRVLQLPSVQQLILILVTMKVGFGMDSVTGLKLQENGVPKETLATIGTLMFPVYLVVPAVMGRFLDHRHPLDNFLVCYPLRLSFVLVAIGAVYVSPMWVGADSEGVPHYALVLLFLLTLVGSVFASAMFTAQMQFFAQLSDPAIGGSYMTLLNTISNLGGQWPGSFALKLVGVLEADSCAPDPATGEEVCRKSRNGYYPVAFLCVVLGATWFVVMRPRMLALKCQKSEAWRGSKSAPGRDFQRSHLAIGAAVIAILVLYKLYI